MIVKQELINRIKDYFDLNIYETKVWLALLGKGIASAGEVANLSRVPRSRAYDVLESLEKKGFAFAKLGKPIKYIGIKPQVILERLRNNVRKEAEEKLVTLSKIKDTEEFTKLEELYKGGISPVKRDNISASLKGKSNISNYLREILRDAEKEIIICTSVDDIKTKIGLFQKTFETLTKANIKIKLALSGNAEIINQIEQRLKIKIKKIDIDTKFFIVDKKEILFYLSKEKDEGDTAIWINSEFFAQAFAVLFEKATGK
jgi:sugar-specific transcriptional regulator TrmB